MVRNSRTPEDRLVSKVIKIQTIKALVFNYNITKRFNNEKDKLIKRNHIVIAFCKLAKTIEKHIPVRKGGKTNLPNRSPFGIRSFSSHNTSQKAHKAVVGEN